MFAFCLAEHRVVPGRFGLLMGWCSAISLWPFGKGSQSAANTTRTMIIKTARVDRIATVNGRGSTLLSGLRLQLPQLPIFRLIGL